MKLSQGLGIAAIIALCTVSAEGKGTAQLGPYIGANVGYSTTGFDKNKIEDSLNNDGYVMTSYSEDNNALGLKLFGGYLFNEYFSVEGGYFNVGKFTYKATTSPRGTLDGSVWAQGVNVDGVGYLPVWKSLSLTGRVGVHYSQEEEKFSTTGFTTSESDHKKSNYGFKVGLGAQYDVTPKLSVRAEWEDYSLRETSWSKADVHLFSVGLVYRFGGGSSSAASSVPVAASKPETVEVATVSVENGHVVFPVDTLFDFDKADIKPSGAASLNALAAKLKPDDKLVITGHTDSLGDDMYNLLLSKRRADAVKTYLISQGIAKTRMQTRAKGETEPIATNATEEGRAANRRVEIDINTEASE